MGRFVWCDIGMYVCSSATVAVQSNTLEFWQCLHGRSQIRKRCTLVDPLSTIQQLPASCQPTDMSHKTKGL